MKNKQKRRHSGSGQRYIRLLMVITIVILLSVLEVIIWDRAEMAENALPVESGDAASEVYPLVLQAYASIEGSGAEYAAPTPTPAVEDVAEESQSAAPTNDSYGGNYILPASSDGQNEESNIAKINIARNVRLTAYCPCEICCGYWALIRPVDGYGNKIVYTSTGALAVPGETVAVNPKFIPHGSYVYVQDPYTEEWREYRATDTSGQMNHVDIYFNDHTAALRSGYGGYGTVYWSAEPLGPEALT